MSKKKKHDRERCAFINEEYHSKTGIVISIVLPILLCIEAYPHAGFILLSLFIGLVLFLIARDTSGD